MNEKNDFIQTLQNMKQNFHYEPKDYYNIVDLINMMIKNSESDSEIWSELLCLIEVALNRDSKDYSCEREFESYLNDQDMFYYSNNGMSKNDIYNEERKFDSLSEAMQNILSFRIVCPNILAPNYRVFN